MGWANQNHMGWRERGSNASEGKMREKELVIATVRAELVIATLIIGPISPSWSTTLGERRTKGGRCGGTERGKNRWSGKGGRER